MCACRTLCAAGLFSRLRTVVSSPVLSTVHCHHLAAATPGASLPPVSQNTHRV